MVKVIRRKTALPRAGIVQLFAPQNTFRLNDFNIKRFDYLSVRAIFSKRQRITLRLLYAISRPFVVCLSSV